MSLFDANRGRRDIKPCDVERILRQLHPVPAVLQRPWQVGEALRVTEGPFQGMQGQVIQVDEATLRVELNIYGRRTPVELSLWEAEPIVQPDA